jgi:hypothetical protein
MLDILVFVHKDASLARYDQITVELQAAGLSLKGRYASVGVIAGTVEDRSLLSQLQKVKDVTAVQELGARPPPE